MYRSLPPRGRRKAFRRDHRLSMGPPDRSSAESHHRKGICDWGIGDSTGGGRRERWIYNHSARGSPTEHGPDDSGNRSMPSWDILTDAFQQVMNGVARGTLRIETEPVPLAEIEDAWERDAHAHTLVV